MNKKNRQSHNRGQTALGVDDWVNDTSPPEPFDLQSLYEDVTRTSRPQHGANCAPIKENSQHRHANPPVSPNAAVPTQTYAEGPVSDHVVPTGPVARRSEGALDETTDIPSEKSFECVIPENIGEMDAKELLAFLTAQNPGQRNTAERGAESTSASQAFTQRVAEDTATERPASATHEPPTPRGEGKQETEGKTTTSTLPGALAGDENTIGKEAYGEESRTQESTAAALSEPSGFGRAPVIETVAAIDAAAGRALFEILKPDIIGETSTRGLLMHENFYRAVTMMPVFRRKNLVYRFNGEDAENVTIRTFSDGYRAVLPSEVMEDCGVNAVVRKVEDLFAAGDGSLSPAKRIQTAIKDPDAAQSIMRVGKALADRVVESEPNTFIAAGRYIFGGNYLDLSSGVREDKEAFGLAYCQFAGEYIAMNVAEARSCEEKAGQCVTILKNDGMLVDYFPMREVPECFRSEEMLTIKGMSSLHHPEVHDAGFVEGECFMVPDGMAVGDAGSLSFLLAPDNGLFFSEEGKEYDGSLAYVYFQSAMGPCHVTLKDSVPLPQKEFIASFLRTGPAIRMAAGETAGDDIPILFFLPPDGMELSKTYLTDIFGPTEHLQINLTKDELDAELAAHGRDAVESLPGSINISLSGKASELTIADMLDIVDISLGNEIPMYESNDIVAGIPLDYVETIAALPNSGYEFVFYRAPAQ